MIVCLSSQFTFGLLNDFILLGAIFITTLAKLFFGARQVAMDSRLLELTNGQNTINIITKSIYYRGVFIFFGGLLGGYLSKLEYINIFILGLLNLPTPLHFVMLIATTIRAIVCIIFYFHPSKSF